MSQNGMKGTIIAAGSVDGATGARVSGTGFVSARTGAGVYTLTLDQPVDATQCAVTGTVRATGVARIINFQQTSDAVKGVEIFTIVPAAVDGSFDFQVVAFFGI